MRTDAMKAAGSSRDIRRYAKAGAGTVIAVSALVAICLIVIPHEAQRAASRPTEGRTQEPIVIPFTSAGDEPVEVSGIDWEYWQSTNPDIVAWITIPDTPIDYPVVQAPKSSPTHYLDYDAYGARNFYGCPYIDSGCTIESPNVVIFGHNMGGIDDSMFTTLTGYLDSAYLSTHQTVVIQTPTEARRLKVRAADEVSPYGYEKRNVFSSVTGLREFYLELWEGADSRGAEPKEQDIDQLFTLITCDRGGAARAVVYVG
jgi:sortase B